MKYALSVFALLAGLSLAFLPPAFIFAAPQGEKPHKTGAPDDSWTRIPAGGKPAYMGIHGGTMPVSLLVSPDGSSLLGFVGQTGNDFLEVLRNAYLPFPSFGNSTKHPVKQLKNAGLFAGNSTALLPVFSLPDDPHTSRTLISRLLPFGLSPQPLSIEGKLEKPGSSMREKKFRTFYLPDQFQTAYP